MPELKPSTLYRNSDAHTYLDQDINDPHQRAVVRSVLAAASIQPGDWVLEIGAGSGRYTRLLLDLGIRVIAAEPDDSLRAKLAATASDSCVVVPDAVGKSTISETVVAVVGFHILHHLDTAVLNELEVQIATAENRSSWRGAAFLEPNPLNPLFMVQVICSPSIRMSEERRLWSVRFHGHGPGRLRVPSHVGLIPPAISRRTGWAPARPFQVKGRWCPWSAYRIVARRKPVT